MKEHKLSIELNQKLKSYALLAGAAVGTAANAQIVYTDIEPDIVIDDIGEYYDLDLNNDGITDFKIEFKDGIQYKSYYLALLQKGISFVGKNYKNRINGKSFGERLISPYLLSDSTIIYGESGNWVNYANLYSFNKFYYYGVLNYENQGGYWDEDIEDKYVGLSFYINDLMFDAWVRLDFSLDEESETMSATIKDYAYVQMPYSPIYAGVSEAEQLPAVTNLVLSDIGNNYNASDLRVTWNAASDESEMDYYYLLIVKTEQVDDVDLEELIRLEGGNGEEINPDGSDSYTYTYQPLSYDVYGNVIIPGVSYTAIVYSVDNDMQYSINRAVSNEITLDFPDEVITEVLLSDVSDNGNASDFQVNFAAASNEINIDEYRIMIVPYSDYTSFDSSTAASVSSNNYTSVSVTGGDKSVILDASALAYNGVTINTGTNYVAFVVSVLSNGDGYYVSPPSNIGSLYIYPPVMTDISVNDIDDAGNTTDLLISLTPPSSFSNINNFYLSIIKASAFSYYSEDLENVGGYYYSTSNFTEGQKDTIQESYLFDINYEEIEEGVDYKLYFISVGNSGTKSISEVIDFKFTSPISALEAPIAAVIPENGDASDFLIVADKYEDEEKLVEYRIMAVPSKEASSFNLDKADTVSEGNYYKVLPLNKDIVTQLSADFKDANGDDIKLLTSYNFFILSVANETANSVNALSDASNTVVLKSITNTNITTLESNKLYAVNDNIYVEIPELSGNAIMYIINTNGALVESHNNVSASDVVTLNYDVPGIYIVKIVDNNKLFTGKILIK